MQIQESFIVTTPYHPPVIRLVLGEDGILVVPAGKFAATEPLESPASAEEGSSSDASGARP
jgi:hypothetical protein